MDRGSVFELPVNRMTVPGRNACVSVNQSVDLDKLPFLLLQHLGVDDPRKLESVILMSSEIGSTLQPPVCTLIRHLRL